MNDIKNIISANAFQSIIHPSSDIITSITTSDKGISIDNYIIVGNTLTNIGGFTNHDENRKIF